MIFGIDYDGTIADTNAMKAKWIKEHLNIKVHPWECDRLHCVPKIGLYNYKKMEDVIYGREWTLKAPPVKGAIKGLKELKRLGEIYIITGRSESSIRWAKEWLKKQNVLYLLRGIISASHRSKGELCQEYSIDVFIDDDERYLRKIKKKDVLLKVLIKDGGPKKWDCPDDIKYVTSWEELLLMIKNLCR